MIEQTCGKCGRGYLSRRRVRKYCSRQCKHEAMRGVPGYWTGRKRPDLAELMRHRQLTKPARYWLGKKRSAEDRAKMSAWQLGRKIPERSGPNHPNWKGGITPEVKKIRNSTAMSIWRKHVFNRDDYTCQRCGKRGGELHADHELPFALFPDLRFEVLNGRTLCKDCHRGITIHCSKQLAEFHHFNYVRH